MDKLTALHTAARRFCQDEFSKWLERYSALERAGRVEVRQAGRVGWDYTEEAYGIFPRYRLTQATLHEVERIVPDSAGSLEKLRALLLQAADAPRQRLMAELQNPRAVAVMVAEADDYRAYIESLSRPDLDRVEPLPYRRVLSLEEMKYLWERLKSRWGVGNGYWFPLKEADQPPNVIAFHEEFFRVMAGSRVLREALAKHRVERVFELHEFGPPDPDYEVELAIVEPDYGRSGEQYSTSEKMDWLVYASHESSITIAGNWLADYFKERWVDWSERTYGGPFSTPDLRGTWQTK